MKNQSYSGIAKDGKKLFLQSWEPDKNGRKLILLIHGLGEYSSRYESWVSLFTRKGYTVMGMDLRGHGFSQGKRGHAQSINQLMDDIDLFYNHSNDLFPDYSKILYGHSMGGTLALNYIIRKNRPFNALIVTSPWLKLVNEPSPVLLSVTGILKNFFPSISVSNKLKSWQISHDPEVVNVYDKDPLVHDRISIGLFHSINQAAAHALRNIYKINCPFLLMHGTDDPITSYKASEKYVMNTRSQIRLKLWEDQYHELHNEPIREDMFKYIIDWLAENKL